eukprot:1907083-Pyramimonas_sp.AAC.1
MTNVATNAKNTKEYPTLLDEFMGAQDELVKQVNAGKISQKLRGAKKADAKANLGNARKKVISLIQTEGVRSKLKFKAWPLDEWKKSNAGRDPHDEGHLVKKIPYPGKGVIWCVLLRKGEDNAADVEIESSMLAEAREEVDDGNNRLRQGQEMAKFKAMQSALIGDAA